MINTKPNIVPYGKYKLRALGFLIKVGSSGYPYLIYGFQIVNKCKHVGKSVILTFSLHPNSRYVATAWLRALGLNSDFIEKAFKHGEYDLHSTLIETRNAIVTCGIGMGVYRGLACNVVCPPTNIHASVIADGDFVEDDESDSKKEPENEASAIDLNKLTLDDV